MFLKILRKEPDRVFCETKFKTQLCLLKKDIESHNLTIRKFKTEKMDVEFIEIDRADLKPLLKRIKTYFPPK